MKGVGKGNTNNPNGRPQGSKNKKSGEWDALGESIIGRHAKHFNDILEDWRENEPDKFAQHYGSILKYFKPAKMQADVNVGDMNITFQNASKEFDFDKDGKSKKK